jgi:hypothetical protein
MRRSLVFALFVCFTCAVAPRAVGQFEVGRLYAHDGQLGDRFGDAVAIDGDTAVVGAPNADGVGTTSGAAYVFRELNGNWIEEAKLLPTDPSATGRFGRSVAIEGNRVVVGAPGADGLATGSGAAYVFKRTGAFPLAAWTQQAKLVASDGATAQEFGACLSLSNGTLAVGAPGYTGAAPTPTVYVFVNSGSSWPEQQKIPTPWGGIAFASSVSIDTDSLVVGAPGVAPFGAAYVFTRATGVWSQQAILTAPLASAANFAFRVALHGETALVSAPSYGHDPNTDHSGAVFAFLRTGTSWGGATLIESAVPTASDEMGTSLALDGARVFAGAPPGSSGWGRAYVFEHVGTTWPQQGQLKAKFPTQNAQFGTALGVSGDNILVGCADGAGNQGSSGTALVFSLIPPMPTAYCAAKINSLGCTPMMAFQGSASASNPTPFALTAQSVLNHKYGLLFFGVSGRASFPFQDGLLCVLPPIRRTVVQDSGGSASGSDCSGSYSFDFNALVQAGTYPDLTPGLIVDCQYWSRDPASPSTTGLTDAIEFGIGF